MSGISDSGLICCACSIQSSRCSGVLVSVPAAISAARAQMREIGRLHALRVGAANRVATGAALHEQMLAAHRDRRCRRSAAVCPCASRHASKSAGSARPLRTPCAHVVRRKTASIARDRRPAGPPESIARWSGRESSGSCRRVAAPRTRGSHPRFSVDLDRLADGDMDFVRGH